MALLQFECICFSERRDNESDVMSESCHLRRESFSECVDDNATSTCVMYNFNSKFNLFFQELFSFPFYEKLLFHQVATSV